MPPNLSPLYTPRTDHADLGKFYVIEPSERAPRQGLGQLKRPLVIKMHDESGPISRPLAAQLICQIQPWRMNCKQRFVL